MRVYPDAEAAAREWGRAVLGADALVLFGFNEKRPLPQVVVTRLGGTPMRVNPPVDEPLIRFEVRANSKAEAFELTSRLQGAADSYVTFPEVPVLRSLIVEGPRWAPDDDQPIGTAARYFMTVQFRLFGTEVVPG